MKVLEKVVLLLQELVLWLKLQVMVFLQYQQQNVRNNNSVDGWYCNGQDGYCIKCYDNTGNNSITSDNAEYRGVYYGVKTYVNMDIPVLNRIFTGLPDFLAVKGETKTIYAKNGCQSMNR